MHKLVKLVGIGLIVCVLAACDKPAAVGQVKLLEGKVAFTLPEAMSDQSGKLNAQTNNTHVYADKNGQKAVIVIIGDNPTDALGVLAKRMETQQRARDANLQVLANKAIEINSQPLQQLNTVAVVEGQKEYSALLLSKVDNHLMTMQISMPADNLQQAQADAEKIISTLKISK